MSKQHYKQPFEQSIALAEYIYQGNCTPEKITEYWHRTFCCVAKYLGFNRATRRIVTTREFGEQLRYGGALYDKMPSDCDGVLVPSGNGLRMLFDRDLHGLRGGYRKFSACELLWAIIRTGRAYLSNWREATTLRSDKVVGVDE